VQTRKKKKYTINCNRNMSNFLECVNKKKGIFKELKLSKRKRVVIDSYLKKNAKKDLMKRTILNKKSS